jgi:hypothetical protein
MEEHNLTLLYGPFLCRSAHQISCGSYNKKKTIYKMSAENKKCIKNENPNILHS